MINRDKEYDFSTTLSTILELDGKEPYVRLEGIKAALRSLIYDVYQEGQNSVVLDYAQGRSEGLQEAKEAILDLVEDFET